MPFAPNNRPAERPGAFSIAGLGSSLPSNVIGNDVVAELVGLSAARIRELFDITERRWVRLARSGPPESILTTADLAMNASIAALADAGLAATDIDAIIAISTTPEYVSPPLDYRLSRRLATAEVFGLTLHTACTGVYRAALIAETLLSSGRVETVLLVAVDALSQYFVFDPTLPKDIRMSTALYGDGAAALIAVRPDEARPTVMGPLSVTTATTERPGIMYPGPFRGRDETLEPTRHDGYHDFQRVLAKGSELTYRAAHAVLEAIGKRPEDVDHVLTHQATGKLKQIAGAFGLAAEKLHVNIDKVGNTLSPSVLILFDELKRRGTFSPGELLLLCSAESATWSYGGMAVCWR